MMDTGEARSWLVMLIDVWNTDAAIRREFDNVADFGLWADEEVGRAIRSAFWFEWND
jgi:hypothetical protein